MKFIKFLILGTVFGIVMAKSEAFSWFRIQEMFRFQSFHMYGVIFSAILVGIISIQIIKRFNVKTIKGSDITIVKKVFNKGTIIGGFTFGLGWAMTGTCPGPMYALFGSGILVFGVVLLSALIGTWTYGKLKDRLPH